MAAVPFDTLKLARRLGDAGMPPNQAKGTAEVLAEIVNNLVTRDDLRRELATLRAEFKAEIASVHADIELLRRDMTIRLGGMLVVVCGILLAGTRYFTLHP